MHIKYEGYGLWPVPESHGGGCTPPLEHTRSITKGEALAPACKASRSGSPHRTVFALECRAHEGGHPALPYLREIPYQHPPRSQCGRNTCLVLRMYTDELGGSPCAQLAYRQGRWQPLTPPSASRRCADSSPVIHALAPPSIMPLDCQRSAAHGDHTAAISSSAVHCTQRGSMALAH